MDRSDPMTVLLVAIAGMLALFQEVQLPTENHLIESGASAVQMNIDHGSAQIVNASYRLVYHCKMIALESIVITRDSVNLVLDLAIESI